LSVRKKVLLVTAIPLVPLAVLAALVLLGPRRERAAQERVAHTLEVRAQINTVYSLLADSETGARAYVLEPHPQTLGVVEEATRSLPSHYEHLLRLVRDPHQRQNVFRLMELDRDRSAAILVTIATNPDDAPTTLTEALAQSRAAMASIRTHIAMMQRYEDVVLGTRVANARQTRQIVSIATAGTLALVMMATLVASIAFSRGLAKRLERLRANANRLAAGEELPSTAAAHDEIGELEDAMQQSSRLLLERDRQLKVQFRELEEARRELTQFFDVSLDMLCIAGTDGRFRKVNPAWTNVLGWRREDLESAPFLDFVHPDDAAATTAETESLAKGAVTVGFENRYRCHDGSYKWLSWKAAADSACGVIYAAARDVTATRHAHGEIRRAHEEAERANKAKSDFVSRMSHDMRTPLNAVLGFAQLLDGEPLSAEQRESVQLISRGGRHLLNLIDEVLDIARIEAGQLSLSPEPVDLGEVAQHAIELIRPLAATRSVRVEMETPTTRYVVHADRQRLNQLLLNLLSNAVKYNRRGGSVRVHFAEGHNTRRVTLLVSDTGLGIPSEKLTRLFTPFERLGAESTGIEGTGLGLAVARGLAEAMGGELRVTSEVEIGSTFSVELAVTDQAVTREESRQTAVACADRRVTGRVLYIEDNPSNVRLMQRIFQRRPGVVLHAASSGRAGLEVAVAMRPDAIFLDLHLPDMHGEDVLREIRSDDRIRPIPVAVLSADATPVQRRTMLSAGAVAYVTKPLDVERVLSVVDTLLGRSSGAAVHALSE
jgi:PAS domain S-box-containing protein